jgi:hypothetical protein
MVPVATAQGSFHARVIAARLGADGIVTTLRGAVDGPYSIQGEVEVLCTLDDFETARDLLHADTLAADDL